MNVLLKRVPVLLRNIHLRINPLSGDIYTTQTIPSRPLRKELIPEFLWILNDHILIKGQRNSFERFCVQFSLELFST